MVNPLEITYYALTGYNPSDEPASDAVIALNEHWTAPLHLKEYNPGELREITVRISDDELHRIDYVRVKDTVTNERWYYYALGHKRINIQVASLRLMLDAFATVGLANISFFGNIARRSLSAAEKADYPLLPEPWAPRRPLKTRRMVIDLNVNKTIKMPSHISVEFEEEVSRIEDTQVINVPNSPLSLSTTPDKLEIKQDLPVGYVRPASDTSHMIATPWGTIQYTTPYEQYLTLSGPALITFLEKAKKYNALDLIEPPYYVPSPAGTQGVILSELSNPTTRNPKASRYYTSVTIRSLASNSARTYTDNDTDLQYNQSLTVVIAPDKNGGIYVIPTTLRDTGLNAYTYLEGVYSPFETVMYNAVGDTPAKFAADGTTLLNTALNNLFQSYINKVNALQYEGMQAKYFKDVGLFKGTVMSFVSDYLGSVSETITTTEAYNQEAIITTEIPDTIQKGISTQNIPRSVQNQTQINTTPQNVVNQKATTSTPQHTGSQSSSANSPSSIQTQSSYSYWSPADGGMVNMPSIQTTSSAGGQTTSTTVTNNSYNTTSNTEITNPRVEQTISGTIETPQHAIETSTESSTSGYIQKGIQNTIIPKQVTRSTTTQEGSSRSVETGNKIAVEGIPVVYGEGEGLTLGTIKTMVFGGYRNEVHSFMLGNINDYLNRWVSIQNDMHNGKVANLFKNITLVGNYTDYNKLVGKYEILITSLAPEDEQNFDLFLDHFGHAVDEYTDKLVTDVRDNYNYTMVGEDAILSNTVKSGVNQQILNQFRTGVRVWKTLIKPENY